MKTTNRQKAIPEGYMTAGEAARKMHITVRTLQYYDREGLLSPSAVSEGGRRLYTDRDILKLHQILSLKHLGFSLGDIKNRLIPLDTPGEVAQVLADQALALQQQIERLSESLRELTALREEVLQMQTVNFKKYADIIVNLQMKNDFYWLIKHFDDQILDHIRSRFNRESGEAFMRQFLDLQEKAIRLREAGTDPGSPEALCFAEKYWNMITEFTGGDFSLLSKLMELAAAENLDQKWKEKQDLANAFIEPALEAYFSRLGINPFQEETK
ncbi:MAG TPA: MerR family transcriptional regulator [Candidatus Scatomonas pullistercoris]|uniref:MerR family transcriptional regulator n=1 Tax=Candidatus Scatomonas pullistercoris TaxID=2840920 RepID=A0A9D1P193_9FIRM|nr:MerR family transcriptional regulator [Candidatus Scatomonas pullistercoris]